MDIYTLSVYDVQKHQDAKITLEMSGYKKILEQVFVKIRQAANTNANQMVFEIPPFMFGLPPINVPQCRAFLISNLEAKGFTARPVNDSHIIISWPRMAPRPENYIVSHHRPLNPGLGISPGATFNPAPYPGQPGLGVRGSTFRPNYHLPPISNGFQPPMLPPPRQHTTPLPSKPMPGFDTSNEEKFFDAFNNIVPRRRKVRFNGGS